MATIGRVGVTKEVGEEEAAAEVAADMMTLIGAIRRPEGGTAMEAEGATMTATIKEAGVGAIRGAAEAATGLHLTVVAIKAGAGLMTAAVTTTTEEAGAATTMIEAAAAAAEAEPAGEVSGVAHWPCAVGMSRPASEACSSCNAEALGVGAAAGCYPADGASTQQRQLVHSACVATVPVVHHPRARAALQGPITVAGWGTQCKRWLHRPVAAVGRSSNTLLQAQESSRWCSTLQSCHSAEVSRGATAQEMCSYFVAGTLHRKQEQLLLHTGRTVWESRSTDEWQRAAATCSWKQLTGIDRVACTARVVCAGSGGRGRGPPAPQRRRDSLPDDVSLVTELKKRHERVS